MLSDAQFAAAVGIPVEVAVLIREKNERRPIRLSDISRVFGEETTMILFVRAKDGKVNHIVLHRQGVDHVLRLRNDGYVTPWGTFTVEVDTHDKPTVKLDGKRAKDASRINDLHKFTFADVGEPDNTPALSASVKDGIKAGDRVGG